MLEMGSLVACLEMLQDLSLVNYNHRLTCFQSNNQYSIKMISNIFNTTRVQTLLSLEQPVLLVWWSLILLWKSAIQIICQTRLDFSLGTKRTYQLKFKLCVDYQEKVLRNKFIRMSVTSRIHQDLLQKLINVSNSWTGELMLYSSAMVWLVSWEVLMEIFLNGIFYKR